MFELFDDLVLECSTPQAVAACARASFHRSTGRVARLDDEALMDWDAGSERKRTWIDGWMNEGMRACQPLVLWMRGREGGRSCTNLDDAVEYDPIEVSLPGQADKILRRFGRVVDVHDDDDVALARFESHPRKLVSTIPS